MRYLRTSVSIEASNAQGVGLTDLMFHDPTTSQGYAALFSSFGPPSRHGCLLRRGVMVLSMFEVGGFDRQLLLVMGLTVHSGGHASVHAEVVQWR